MTSLQSFSWRLSALCVLALFGLADATAATVTATTSSINNNYWVWAWTPLTTTNSDGSVATATDDSGDTTVQVSGTFGVGGTVVIQGSLDNSTWATLTQLSGSAASFTAAGVANIAETPPYIRPFVSAGDGTTSLTVRISKRRNRMQ